MEKSLVKLILEDS